MAAVESNRMPSSRATRAPSRVAPSSSVLVLFCAVALGAIAHAQQTTARQATPEEVTAFFRQQSKKVLTFVGYSGRRIKIEPRCWSKQNGSWRASIPRRRS
jgi:hypothetical protein